jgi:flagellar hook-associated protein 2
MADVSITAINSYVASAVQTYRTSLMTRITALQDKQTTLTAKSNALSDIRTKIQALNTAVTALTGTGSNSPLAQYAVASSDTSVATATGSSTATIGSHSLFVSQLAKADTVLSSQMTNAGTTISATEGAGTKTFSLMVGNTSTSISVTLGGAETDKEILSKIADAVSKSGAGVSASVVTDTSSTSRLVFRSAATGSGSALSLSDVTGTLMSDIGLNASVVANRTVTTATGAGYVYTNESSLDAKFTLDNIDFVRQSNTVTDTLSGVTLKLTGIQDASENPIDLTVQPDTSQIQSAVQNFITAYNSVYSTLTAKTATDPTTHVRQILAGDSTLRGLRLDMSGVVSSALPGVNLRQLADIGVTMASDGTLTMSDTTKLQSALQNGTTDISNLFNSTNGIATQLKTLLDGFTKKDGIMDAEQTGVSNQLTNLKTQITNKTNRVNADVTRYQKEFAALTTLLINANEQLTEFTTIFNYSG